MSLQEYREKRDFKKTLEPKGTKAHSKTKNLFVIQKHHASHLHYDFRLELGGTLKSWAVPKGPSLDPHVKRLAVEVEDHPLSYARFEGEIPADEYGGGHVIVWDIGEWVPPAKALEQLKKGRLEFELKGQKLSGHWVLIRTRTSAKGTKHQWLLIKRTDEAASEKTDITEDNESVLTGRTVEELRSGTQTKTVKKKLKKSLALQKEKPSVKTSFKKSTLPTFTQPELAFLVDSPPVGENWVHEIKYDGYRTLARKEKHNLKLLTRSGLDWSHKYPEIHDDCLKIPAQSFMIDGEIAAIDEQGHTHFQELQNALEFDQTKNLVYYVFDLLYLNGVDITDQPLAQRKKLLAALLKTSKSKRIIYSEHWQQKGSDVFASACGHQLEGIISKNLNSTYESGRSKNWLKTKCTHIQEFVIGGYTLQENKTLAALLVGAYNEDHQFQYIGRVGTGFNRQTQASLLPKLKKTTSDTSAFEIKSPKGRDIIWTQPKLVANVEFGAWTDEKILRHAAFKGLREDKKAQEVFLEEAQLATNTIKNSSKKQKKSVSKKVRAEKHKLELTHPDKILFPKEKITKQDLAEYYIAIKDWILPFVVNRPLSLLRCPHGEGKTCFFQKHIESDGVGILSTQIKAPLHKKQEDITYIDSAEGLVELVQMGNLEIHSRGGLYTAADYANLIVFDLDPDPGVSFAKVKEAAFALHDMLEKLGLKTFIKTSGGKGLHIHVPIKPDYTWDEIKNFSRSVCDQLVKEHPNSYTTQISKSKRKGKIFLDYLRNGYGATAITAYSVRAKPHASVAFPITWNEAKKLKAPDQFTMKDVQKLLKKRKDPWTGYFKLKQKIKILDQIKKQNS